MKETKTSGFNWLLPVLGALGALILLLPKLAYGNDVLAVVGMVCLALLIASSLLIVAIRKVRRDSFAVLTMLATFFASGWLLFQYSDEIRSTVRWRVHSNSYKAQILNQPTPTDGNFKHMEWDGWGFPGAGDTTVYLVYDPSDQLAAASKSDKSGTYNGIPCPVVYVHHLEHHWYTTLFYTDTHWDLCS